MTNFGFRFFEFTADQGFFLNGEHVELKGVCLHHDLGPLGAAVNKSSLKHRLKLLKDMGCNAIRTAHNPPAPELLELTDEMGFLVIDEIFDEWEKPKVENGYNHLWNQWAEKDLTAFIHRDRNHPSVIMWSLGNEIRDLATDGGAENCKFLNDIAKKEDPTRPTTIGFNHEIPALKYNYVEMIDVPGWNYEPKNYNSFRKDYPNLKMYGSETSSTVSSRGIYFLPAERRTVKNLTEEPFHVSGYSLDVVPWGQLPDYEFKAQDQNPGIAGEFVWTGVDYLGEPTPFNTAWPARSSYFGIIDLCGIPKDRYYLYQSKWTDKEVLHLIPHWNWEAGQRVDVHCYTNYQKAQLFLNGRSLGVRKKDTTELLTSYRLIWKNIMFEPGELKVVTLDTNNQPVKEMVRKTAGKAAKIKMKADRSVIAADGKELCFITVSVIDEKGTLCPNADHLINFSIVGNGTIKAVGNGDPTSLESFVEPYRKVFNGKCMVIVQSTTVPGTIEIGAKSVGLESAFVNLNTEF